MFPKLFKYSSNGTPQEWQIFVQEDYYYTTEGQIGGKLTTSLKTYCVGKNKGKKNETSGVEQALLEAQAKHNKKLKEGYNTVLVKEAKFFEPMLAKVLEDYSKLLFTVPTYISPKLDGIRSILKDGHHYSRKGNRFFTVPHLEIECPFILDGELYTDTLSDNFNKIVSLVKKQKPSSQEIEECRNIIQYHIYDIYDSDVYSVRFNKLLNWYNSLPKELKDFFKIVPVYRIYDLKQLDNIHENYISNGYEGSMIRLDLKGYENKRSNQLLKNKSWKDEEFEIIDVTEGKGNAKGIAATLIVNVNGKECEATTTGDFQYRAELLKNRDKLKGLKATIKFFDYTPDGSLRFPTLKSIRDYE